MINLIKKLIDDNEHELTEINKKKLKGVSNAVVKHDITHVDYRNVSNINKPKTCCVYKIFQP